LVMSRKYRTRLIRSDADVALMTADGAYDGETAYDAVAERYPGPRLSFRHE
jgi:hypothetical protein